MIITTTCTCAGLPGKPCKTVFLPEVGYVPPFSAIGKGRVTEQQLLAAVRCDRCARLYPAMVAGVRRMYRLTSALAQVRKGTPTTSLGALLETSSVLQGPRRVAAERVRQEEAQRRRARDEQAARLLAAAQSREAIAV